MVGAFFISIVSCGYQHRFCGLFLHSMTYLSVKKITSLKASHGLIQASEKGGFGHRSIPALIFFAQKKERTIKFSLKIKYHDAT